MIYGEDEAKLVAKILGYDWDYLSECEKRELMITGQISYKQLINCKDCRDNGFDVCEIKCLVPCELCVRYDVCIEEQGMCEKCERPLNMCTCDDTTQSPTEVVG
jgi:hypothetical protein